MGELRKTRWAVMLMVGGPGITPSLYAMDIPCSFSTRFSPLFTRKRSDFSVFVARSRLFRYTLC